MLVPNLGNGAWERGNKHLFFVFLWHAIFAESEPKEKAEAVYILKLRVLQIFFFENDTTYLST